MKAFDGFKDNAKVWIYPTREILTPVAETAVRERMQTFLKSWEAHGAAVTGSFDVIYGRFLVLVADAESTQVSGCSIDSSVHAVEEAVTGAGSALAEGGFFYAKIRDLVTKMDRREFALAVAQGKITENTVVFNNAVQTLGELRSGAWEGPFSKAAFFRRFTMS